jgi:hypothetical protein
MSAVSGLVTLNRAGARTFRTHRAIMPRYIRQFGADGQVKSDNIPNEWSRRFEQGGNITPRIHSGSLTRFDAKLTVADAY